MKLITALLFMFLVGCATTSQPEAEAANDDHAEETALVVIFSLISGMLGGADDD